MKRLVKHTVVSLAALVVVLCEVEQAEAVPAYNFTQIAASSNELNSLQSINAGGTVAFLANPGNVLLVGNGGPVTVLYDDTGPIIGFGGHPSINDSGVVAFIGVSNTLPGRIFKGDGGPPTSISSSGNNVDINSSGTVAFSTGLGGVFTGIGGPLTTIADGTDSLLGFDDPSINDQGVVVFHALFNTGGGDIRWVSYHYLR